MGLVYYTGNYYLWISLELLLGIVYSIILNWKVNQVYPWLKSEVKQGKLLFKKYPEVTRYTKQLFVHNWAVSYNSKPLPSWYMPSSLLRLWHIMETIPS